MTREYALAGDVPEQDLLTTDQAVALTPFTKSAFLRWRLSWPNGQRRGPKPLKVEGRVFYRRGDVLDWLNGGGAAET